MACNCTDAILSSCSNQDLLNLAGLISSLGCGPVGTNLSYMPSPVGGTILSSTGSPAFVPLANAVNAGLLSPALYTKLVDLIPGGTIPVFTTTVNGLVPAPLTVSGRVLSDNGTWIPVTGGGGTVLSVTGTGTVSGITLSGSGTTNVTLTLGGAISLALDGLSDVEIITPLDTQVLTYETASGLWKNKTPTVATNYWTLIGSDIRNNNATGTVIAYKSGGALPNTTNVAFKTQYENTPGAFINGFTVTNGGNVTAAYIYASAFAAQSAGGVFTNFEGSITFAPRYSGVGAISRWESNVKVKYTSDMRSTFDDLTLVDKGYVDRIQITIVTAANFSTSTLSTDLPAISQHGKNVIIDNSTATGTITLTCNGNVTASYLKHGANAITFLKGANELWFEGASVLLATFNGLPGSTANLTTYGGRDYLAIVNY